MATKVYSVEGPDGRIYDIEGPEGASDQQVIAALMQHLQSQPKPQSGFKAGAKAGLENLKGDIYSGLAALGVEGAAEKSAEHRQKASEMFQMPEFTEHPVDYVTSLLGQSVPYMAAPLAAGAAASFLPAEIAAAPVLGGLTTAGRLASTGAAGAASAAQFTGSNLSRQLESGTRPEDLQLGNAAAAAVPQAALDVISFKFIPGIRNLFGRAGVQIGEQEAKGIVSKYITPALKTAGVEGGTEAAQQVFERLQAGLAINDPEARKEYFDNFLGGAVLGGTLAVPGSLLEGGKRAAPTVAPTQAAPEVAPEKLPPAVVEALAQEKHEAEKFPKLVENIPPAPVAAEEAKPEEPTVAPNVVKLMDEHESLATKLDPLEKQLQEAAAKGDTSTINKLVPEYQALQNQLGELKTQIEGLGGTTLTAEQLAEEAKTKIAGIDKKLASAQKKLTDASELGEFDRLPALSAKLDALRQEKEKLQAEIESKQQKLQYKATPEGETLPLFAGEEAAPKAEEVLKEAPTPEENKALAAKQAQADKLLQELTAMMPKRDVSGNVIAGGPKPASEESRRDAMTALTEARQSLRKLQEMSAAKPSLEMDEAVSNAQAKVAQLSNQLASLSQRGKSEQFITEMNKKSEELNQLYADIDAMRGGFERAAEPSSLFGKRNLLYTAATSGNPEDMLKLVQYEREQKKAEKAKERSESRDKLIETLQKRMDLPGRVSERTATPEEYQRVMDEIERIHNSVVGLPGNAKQSVYDKAEGLHKRLQELEAVIQDPTARAQQKGYARRSHAQITKQYETLINGKIVPARDRIFDLYRSLYEVKEVKRASEVAEEKRKESEAFGRSFRQLSPTAKKAARVQDVEKTAAKMVGESKELAALASALGKDDAAYEKAEKEVEKRIDKLAAKYGPNDKAVSSYRETSRQELENLAISLGKKTPEFKAAQKEALDAYKKSLSASEQAAPKYPRQGQATRKLPKLGKMATGSEESKAETERRQALFAEGLESNKEIERKQAQREAVEEIKKRKTKPAGTAMAAAMQKAARDMAEGVESEQAKALRGSEAESKNLTEEQVNALENNDVSGALNSIIDDDTNTPVNRAVAVALEAFLDATNVNVHDRLYTPDGQEVLGMATSKQIDISKAGLSQETLLHEGVHSAAERVIAMAKEDINQLSKEQQAAYRELERLFNAVKADPSITSVNAKSDISEFAAEALSNEKLQAQLRAKKWTLGDAFKSFTSFILKMIGVKNVDNMMDASLAAVEALMVPTSVGQTVTEEAKALPKDVGVFEKAKNVFGFKSHSEPAEVRNSSFVAQDPKMVDDLKANFLGLAGRVQLVDKFAAISEAFKKGLAQGQINALEAGNGEYFLRFGENRSQYAQQALTNGPVNLVPTAEKDGYKEYVYKSEKGANLMRVFEILQKAGIKNSTEVDRMFTAYMAGKRAQQVGWNKLWVGNPAKAEAEYNGVIEKLNADPKAKEAFEEAAKEYKAFNNGLIDFLVQTGAMTKEKAAELKKIDYVPYYRVNKGSGDVELFTDKEAPIRIGNIKDEPQLQELVGDNTQILPLSVSAVQNAFMLTDMGLRNQRVKDTSFLLHKMGIASSIGEGAGPANRDTVHFRVNGKPHFAVIDTDMYGIPADLIVKGMEGIKTNLPFAVKAMGVPADLLRKFVTRNPAYAIKQAIRDPLTAWMTTGTDGVPILNSFKELSSMVAGRSETERKLMEAGAISSNVFTGDKGDMQRFLRDISAGKSGWEKLLAKADAFALQGDAATRAVIYKDSIAKGMSEQQALLRTLESMNFGRRGLSPTIHFLNTMIPFFNAQIQGLDVLYRAFTGNMPYSEQLKIRQKLMTRGLMLAAGTLAYAAMMQDDEAYKRAKPEERLGNWFVYIPGMDEPLKVPIPFELGYLFKSLPEAVFNMGADDERSSDITKGMGKLVAMSNPVGMPQAVKPVVELYLGKSFFSGDIESQREQKTMLPTERARGSTTEVAKLLGSITGDAGITPIGWDHLVRGYTGGLGIALLSAANPLLNTETSGVEQPSKKLHETPFIGGLFQPVEGRGTLDASYERMLEIQQVKGTFERLLMEGKRDEAKEFLDQYRNKLSASSVSGAVQQQLGQLAAARRQVVSAPNMSQEKKDMLLERIDAAQYKLARRFLDVTGETTPPASHP